MVICQAARHLQKYRKTDVHHSKYLCVFSKPEALSIIDLGFRFRVGSSGHDYHLLFLLLSRFCLHVPTLAIIQPLLKQPGAPGSSVESLSLKTCPEEHYLV